MDSEEAFNCVHGARTDGLNLSNDYARVKACCDTLNKLRACLRHLAYEANNLAG